MRKLVPIAAGLGLMLALGGCAHRGFARSRPDEFAVARAQPLIVPPDFSLVPPQPGVAAAQGTRNNDQTLDALFGGPAARSAAESATLDGATSAATPDPGIRSSVGDPGTNVVDKGATTRDIIAAPQSDGKDARATTK